MNASLWQRGRTADLVCVAFLFVVTAVYFHPFWLDGRVFVPSDTLFNQEPWKSSVRGFEGPHNHQLSDAIQQHYPWRFYFQKELRQRRVALWNPHQFCGAPFAANDQSAIYYPLNAALYSRLDAPEAYTVSAWLHLFLAGLFMFLLLRFHGAGPAGGVAGALVFMLNGCHTVWMAHAAKQAAMTWAPLLLLLAGISIRRRSTAAAFLGAAASGMLLTAGFLQHASYALLALFVYLVFMGAAYRKRQGVRRAVVTAVVMIGGGVALAAVHVWPVLELAAQAARPVVQPHNGWFPGVPLQFAKLIVRPDALGSPVSASGPLGFNYTEVTFYVPLLALILCTLAARRAFSKTCPPHQRWATACFLVLLVFGLAAMFGTPAYALYYYLAPGAKTLAVTRIGYVFTLAASVLAGLGMAALLEMASRMGRPAPGEQGAMHRLLRAGAVAVGIIGLTAALLPWSMKFNVFVPRDMVLPDNPAVKFLVRTESPSRFFSGDNEWMFFPDLATGYGFDDLRGYDSLYPSRIRNFLGAVQDTWGHEKLRGKRRAATVADAPLVYAAPPLDWLNVCYILTRHELPSEWTWMHRTRAGGVNIYTNSHASHRVIFSRGYVVEPDPARALDMATSRDSAAQRGGGPLRPEEQVILEREPAFPRPGGGADTPPFPEKNTYRILEWAPGSMELEVAAAHPGLLFISDIWYPGWRATVGGKPAEVMRANYAFRAVAVPAGSFRVRMWFAPKSALAGLGISLAALFAVAAGVVFLWFIRGSRRRLRIRASFDR